MFTEMHTTTKKTLISQGPRFMFVLLPVFLHRLCLRQKTNSLRGAMARAEFRIKKIRL